MTFLDGPPIASDFRLSSIRDELSCQPADPAVDEVVQRLLTDWRSGARALDPYREVQSLVEGIRTSPIGRDRIRLMNALIRAMGRPEVLADYLDMLRWSATQRDPGRTEWIRKLQAMRLHSVYGWCGNTVLVESGEAPTAHTAPTPPGLAEKLGVSPLVWNLTIHVWQPNRTARGFAVAGAARPESLSEPPHSHPFDFVSIVVRGRFWQSIYRQVAPGTANSGRYAGSSLVHVDGVWPPHEFSHPAALQAIEDRVLLEAGQSYFMPSQVIHDVAFDRRSAHACPTITLFLSSEFTAMPHAYIAPSMADHHDRNPDLRLSGRPVSEYTWHEKLVRLSRYLRGESSTLDLDEIIRHESEYAFFHL